MRNILLMLLVFGLQPVFSEKNLYVKTYEIQDSMNFSEEWKFSESNQVEKKAYTFQTDVYTNIKKFNFKQDEVKDLNYLKQMLDEVYNKKIQFPYISCKECTIIPERSKIIVTHSDIKRKKEVIFNELSVDDAKRIYEVNYNNKVVYFIDKNELYENSLLNEVVIYLNKLKTYTSTCIFGENNSVKCDSKK